MKSLKLPASLRNSLLALGLVLALSGAQPLQAQELEYVHKDPYLGFSINLPSKPAANPAGGDAMLAVDLICEGPEGKLGFGLSCYAYPPDLDITALPHEQTIDALFDAQLTDLRTNNSTKLEERRISHQGMDGIAMHGFLDSVNGPVRIVIFKLPRAYYLIGIFGYSPDVKISQEVFDALVASLVFPDYHLASN